ncbi:MAG: pyruvate dehydrogenase (acetyl-transferring) E1 component subunit alpha [Sulfurimonas sp.]|uniref:pyruvate dehydrogenase (acetyl-transferring) E1 component subunit alpha n=1 Tax=Sulfurimonas sp. TaxID=2022749 RepID=UPI003D149B47
MKKSTQLLKKYYKQMLLVRRFEEKCVELYAQEHIRGFLHLYIGQEAIAVGVMDALTPDDSVLTTYRDHGQALVRGVSPNAVMAELYGKLEGCSRGRGGSMHLFDAATRFYGGSAIVGAGLPLAVGIALADKMKKQNNVTVCFFGDGAVAEGEFHESLNLAALWNLPILFVCENNLYGMGTALELSESQTDLAKKAASYKITSSKVDGMRVLDVAKAAKAAVAEIKKGNGPFFLECLAYRFRGHSMFDAELYRDKKEVDEWKKKDPITLFTNELKKMKALEELDLQEIEEEVSSIIDEAVLFAQNGTLEPIEDLKKFIYATEAEDE